MGKRIEDVRIEVGEGKVRGMVGGCGSGKRRVMGLMVGYYGVLEGKMKIGNSEMKKVKKKWWGRECGVVMEDGVMLWESMGRNIGVDDGDIDKEGLLKGGEIGWMKD